MYNFYFIIKLIQIFIAMVILSIIFDRELLN